MVLRLAGGLLRRWPRLARRHPQTTEEAQYCLPFPVAAALVHQRLGPAELSGEKLDHPLVYELTERIELVEDPAYSKRFPADRLARVEIETVDGVFFDSGEVEATWGAEDPPADEALREKFRWLARTTLSDDRARRLEEMIWQVADLPDIVALLDLLTSPPNLE